MLFAQLSGKVISRQAVDRDFFLAACKLPEIVTVKRIRLACAMYFVF